MASRGRDLARRRHGKVCERKRRFESEAEAKGSLRRTVADGSAQIGSLNVYRCAVCKGWHVGHTPRRGADPR